MNLFNDINKSYMTGMMLPAATVLTFSALILTLGYMDRILNKKLDIDFRIAKVKARLNAESGVAITISGPSGDGWFVPSIGSASWPVISDEDIDVYEADIIDSTTFEGYHKPEIPSSFFPNAGIPSTVDIDMGEFYDVVLKTYEDNITRRPGRSGSAHGRAKVEGFWGNDVYLIDSAEVKYTVEVLSDFLYLTHHEKAGGAPGIFGPGNSEPPGPSTDRRQPCFGGLDAFGATDAQSLVGFVQTLDPMLICGTWSGYPVFNNLVYITKATNNLLTNPTYWVDSEFNDYTGYDLNEPIMPITQWCGCTTAMMFQSDEGTGDGSGLNNGQGWEIKDPVCFPLQGYKNTVLSAIDIYDSTEKLKLSNTNNANLKDTLIMTDIRFLSTGGYQVKRWWYLMPPYLHSEVLTCNGNNPSGTVGTPCTMSGDYQEGRPWMLEGMPTDFDPTITQGSNAVNDAIATQISNECEGQNAWTGDFTRCDPYEESLHDFSSLKVGTINPNNGNTINNTGHGQVINGGQILPCTPQEDCESFNTFYENGSSNETMNNVPGGGVTRLSHYDIENFTDYFGDKNFEEASFDFQDIPQANGGNLIEQTVQSYPEGTEVIIYVKGGPVRVHGTFKGAYTVVTSGWDAVGGNNCLDAGCAGYDGYSTYYRHAWVDSPEFNNTPIDTIPTNIWVTDNLVNVEANGFNCPPGVNGICPPQPTVFDVFTGDIICDFEAPGDCGGSENIMGLVSAANVVVANSPNNRVGGIDLHASVVALNESFVMHYWQNGFIDGCGGGAPYDLFDGGTCVQTPPQSDNRGRAIYNNEPDGRGDLRLWGGIIQKYRGYMNRQAAGPYATNGDIGMDKAYRFDNNLYFPPPGAIKITECESNTIRMSMWDYGMIRP